MRTIRISHPFEAEFEELARRWPDQDVAALEAMADSMAAGRWTTPAAATALLGSSRLEELNEAVPLQALGIGQPPESVLLRGRAVLWIDGRPVVVRRYTPWAQISTHRLGRLSRIEFALHGVVFVESRERFETDDANIRLLVRCTPYLDTALRKIARAAVLAGARMSAATEPGKVGECIQRALHFWRKHWHP